MLRFPELGYGQDAKTISYIINKHKYVELLCVLKSDCGFHNIEMNQKEIFSCLSELERTCSSKEEYHKLVVQLDFNSPDQHLDLQVGILSIGRSRSLARPL